MTDTHPKEHPGTATLAAELRMQGRPWVEIAAQLRQRFGLKALTALRLAHGWSQERAAEEWNRRWPDETKNAKHFAFWENWPGQDGYPPTQFAMQRLAELYECAAADLVLDVADYRDRDEYAA